MFGEKKNSTANLSRRSLDLDNVIDDLTKFLSSDDESDDVEVASKQNEVVNHDLVKKPEISTDSKDKTLLEKKKPTVLDVATKKETPVVKKDEETAKLVIHDDSKATKVISDSSIKNEVKPVIKIKEDKDLKKTLGDSDNAKEVKKSEIKEDGKEKEGLAEKVIENKEKDLDTKVTDKKDSILPKLPISKVEDVKTKVETTLKKSSEDEVNAKESEKKKESSSPKTPIVKAEEVDQESTKEALVGEEDDVKPKVEKVTDPPKTSEKLETTKAEEIKEKVPAITNEKPEEALNVKKQEKNKNTVFNDLIEEKPIKKNEKGSQETKEKELDIKPVDKKTEDIRHDIKEALAGKVVEQKESAVNTSGKNKEMNLPKPSKQTPIIKPEDKSNDKKEKSGVENLPEETPIEKARRVIQEAKNKVLAQKLAEMKKKKDDKEKELNAKANDTVEKLEEKPIKKSKEIINDATAEVVKGKELDVKETDKKKESGPAKITEKSPIVKVEEAKEKEPVVIKEPKDEKLSAKSVEKDEDSDLKNLPKEKPIEKVEETTKDDKKEPLVAEFPKEKEEAIKSADKKEIMSPKAPEKTPAIKTEKKSQTAVKNSSEEALSAKTMVDKVESVLDEKPKEKPIEKVIKEAKKEALADGVPKEKELDTKSADKKENVLPKTPTAKVVEEDSSSINKPSEEVLPAKTTSKNDKPEEKPVKKVEEATKVAKKVGLADEVPKEKELDVKPTDKAVEEDLSSINKPSEEVLPAKTVGKNDKPEVKPVKKTEEAKKVAMVDEVLKEKDVDIKSAGKKEDVLPKTPTAKVVEEDLNSINKPSEEVLSAKASDNKEKPTLDEKPIKKVEEVTKEENVDVKQNEKKITDVKKEVLDDKVTKEKESDVEVTEKKEAGLPEKTSVTKIEEATEKAEANVKKPLEDKATAKTVEKVEKPALDDKTEEKLINKVEKVTQLIKDDTKEKSVIVADTIEKTTIKPNNISKDFAKEQKLVEKALNLISNDEEPLADSNDVGGLDIEEDNFVDSFTCCGTKNGDHKCDHGDKTEESDDLDDDIDALLANLDGLDLDNDDLANDLLDEFEPKTKDIGVIKKYKFKICTSLASMDRHMVSRTNKLITILLAQEDITEELLELCDIGTDEDAKKMWYRKALNASTRNPLSLPGIFRENGKGNDDIFIGNYEMVYEYTEHFTVEEHLWPELKDKPVYKEEEESNSILMRLLGKKL